jgi:hypothetical protein
LQVPLDLKIKSLPDIPYTISYVIKKRQQIDSYRELPSTHQPPDYMIWDASPEELEEFFDRVLKRKEDRTVKLDLSEIEG